ncbi:ATP-binding protein [Nocardia sp. CDC159]|uniref:histidine kinase n=1 Tax=Nocardia pulmonis TaxID=2951408 RepID=A0A9X2E6E6_9NOCA|nr:MULTISPECIES: ATP-binding protein [Nocardia]MCM6775167.1 ATP-binding protein [Nocardia pulmonis]MCM6789637.1 ATP-binding protein [Nocardia sp. CDC159]
MTSKVGIVLLLPVLLASTFAVLRIKDELGRIAELDAASEQARIIRPTLAFAAAAEQLAVVAGGGERPTDAVLDQATGRFDKATAELQSALKTTRGEKRAIGELTEALAAGRTLRNNPRANNPTAIGQQADEVARHVGTALTALPTPQDGTISHYFDQLGAVAAARRQFTQQQLLITGGEIGDNPAALARVLSAIGAEQTMVHHYTSIAPDSAVRPEVLLNALQTRMNALSQNSSEPIAVPGVADSMRISTDAYNEATDRLATLIDSGLSRHSIDARTNVLRDVALVVVTLLVGLALALAVARSLVVPVRRLRRDALQVAHTDLPAELAVVREGGATPEIVPVDVDTTEEIGQLARAVDDMHRQALHLAAEQARLRLQIGNMFETLSRRSQSLVEQQLALIEDLERDEDDSDRLQSLFRLDHLATRMRRNGDNLLVLAGTALRRGMLPPTPLSDMLWSAVSQVEDYQRVEIGTVPDGIVAGEPAVDIEHLLAELIDNSLRYSPPNTPVAVSVTRAVDGGYLIEITDRGLGMSSEDLRAINERLASGGEVTVETARRMGLFVVGRLAKRHTVTVSLRRTSAAGQQAGITASVHLPGALVSPLPESATGPQPIIAPFPSPLGPTPLAAVPDAEQTGLFTRPEPELPQRRPGEAADFGPPIPAEDLEGPDPALTDGLFTHGGTGHLFTHRESAHADNVIGGSAADFGRDDEVPAAAADAPELDPVDDDRREWEPARSDDDLASRDPESPWADEPFADRDADPSGQEDPFPRQDSEPTRTDNSFTPEDFASIRAEDGFVRQNSESEHAEDESAQQDSEPLDIWAEAEDYPPQRDDEHTLAQQPAAEAASGTGDGPTPIYQRMVSEWLVEPSSSGPVDGWSSPADAGWAAAAEASSPTTARHTEGGLPIRRPGAQLVPGGLTTTNRSGAPDPEEIRTNLSRHLSGVRSGRADAQYYDGGPA